MANQSTLRYLYSLTTARVPHHDSFVKVHMSGVAKTYIRSTELKDCPHPQIAEAAWYFAHYNPARSTQVQAKVKGVCVLVSPPEGEEQWLPCGSLAYMPALLKLIEHQETPSFVCEQTKERSIMSAAVHAKGSECRICLEYPAAYRWKECFHVTDGPALVCLCCRSFILNNIKDGRKRRKKYDVRAACIICRKASALVLLIFTSCAASATLIEVAVV